MDSITQAERDALREAAEKATPGPWELHRSWDSEMYVRSPAMQVIASPWLWGDGQFIVAACNAAKPLLDALRASEERAAAMEQERDAAVRDATRYRAIRPPEGVFMEIYHKGTAATFDQWADDVVAEGGEGISLYDAHPRKDVGKRG